MTLFDAYIFVDWSSASSAHTKQPKADAVWVGELVPTLKHQQETYHRTRFSGVARVIDFLKCHIQEDRRVLVGFDFPYGYPAGLANGLAISSGPNAWWSIWCKLSNQIQDSPNNQNNRFAAAGELNDLLQNGLAGPFWGCPVGTAYKNLESRSPGFPFVCANGETLQRLRIVEKRLPGTQETWKLFGAGSVGSQELVGIPYLHKLKQLPELNQLSQVWPFETGFTSSPSPNQGPYILHAEIWPGLVEQRVQLLVNANPDLIRDRAQVRAMCEWAAEHDEAKTLGTFFQLPEKLDQEQTQACLEQEGWVLGAR